jgi:DNA repair protein RadD
VSRLDAGAGTLSALVLRNYRVEAIEAIHAYFTNSGNPLVVLPTGTGKRVVIGGAIRRALVEYPDTRLVLLVHVRELIGQNQQKLLAIWPEAPIGVHSAGLGKHELGQPVLFCGIRSVHRKAYGVKRRDLLLVDEAHLIPPSAHTMYRRFLGDLQTINPRLKVIGFTATPYRMGTGVLHRGRGAAFTDIAYEADLLRMIEEGWLAPLVPKEPVTRLIVDGVGTRGGEFIASQLEAVVDVDTTTRAAINELVEHGADRRAWVAFCSGVKHAEHVRDAIRAHGFTAETVTGATAARERDKLVSAFCRGEICCLTNANVLTVGFDAPFIDVIAVLRPTESPGL